MEVSKIKRNSFHLANCCKTLVFRKVHSNVKEKKIKNITINDPETLNSKFKILAYLITNDKLVCKLEVPLYSSHDKPICETELLIQKTISKSCDTLDYTRLYRGNKWIYVLPHENDANILLIAKAGLLLTLVYLTVVFYPLRKTVNYSQAIVY